MRTRGEDTLPARRDDGTLCVSHLRIDMRRAALLNGRCGWCFDERERLGTGQDVWIERLRVHEGQRVLSARRAMA